jgi:hypothetical protein
MRPPTGPPSPPSAERHDQALEIRGALSPRSHAPRSRPAAVLSRYAPPAATAAVTETPRGGLKSPREIDNESVDLVRAADGDHPAKRAELNRADAC